MYIWIILLHSFIPWHLLPLTHPAFSLFWHFHFLRISLLPINNVFWDLLKLPRVSLYLDSFRRSFSQVWFSSVVSEWCFPVLLNFVILFHNYGIINKVFLFAQFSLPITPRSGKHNKLSYTLMGHWMGPCAKGDPTQGTQSWQGPKSSAQCV